MPTILLSKFIQEYPVKTSQLAGLFSPAPPPPWGEPPGLLGWRKLLSVLLCPASVVWATRGNVANASSTRLKVRLILRSDIASSEKCKQILLWDRNSNQMC